MDYAEYRQSLALTCVALAVSLLAAIATWAMSRPLAWAALALSIAAARYVVWRRRTGLKEAGELPARKVATWQRLVIGAMVLFYSLWVGLFASNWHLTVSPELKISSLTLLVAFYVLWAATTLRIPVAYDDDL